MGVHAPDINREPPHNTEAEAALLGAVLVNNAAWHACPMVATEHFAG